MRAIFPVLAVLIAVGAGPSGCGLTAPDYRAPAAGTLDDKQLANVENQHLFLVLGCVYCISLIREVTPSGEYIDLYDRYGRDRDNPIARFLLKPGRYQFVASGYRFRGWPTTLMATVELEAGHKYAFMYDLCSAGFISLLLSPACRIIGDHLWLEDQTTGKVIARSPARW